MDKRIKVLSLFSGLGAFEEGLKEAKIDYDLINFCEVDSYPSRAYSLGHSVSEKLNLGDITKVNEKELDDFDLVTWGSPCQDFSIAGVQKGSIWTCNDCLLSFNPLAIHYEKRNCCPNCKSLNLHKTRSSLLVEGLRIIREKKPSFSVYENVKHVVSEKHILNFNLFLKELEEYGYKNYYTILNSKNYGVPQSRERIFVVSIRNDINIDFKFPEIFDSKIRLKNFLEEEVSEKYYLSKDIVEQFFCNLNEEVSEISNLEEKVELFTIDNETNEFIKMSDVPIAFLKKITEINKNELIFVAGIQTGNMWLDNGKKLSRNYKQGNRIYSFNGIACTQSANGGGLGGTTGLYLIVKKLDSKRYLLRIRKLTPKESFRLMGFKDEYIEILKKSGFSNTKLYKMAGNSIVVNVAKYIFKSLFEEYIKKEED